MEKYARNVVRREKQVNALFRPCTDKDPDLFVSICSIQIDIISLLEWKVGISHRM